MELFSKYLKLYLKQQIWEKIKGFCIGETMLARSESIQDKETSILEEKMMSRLGSIPQKFLAEGITF